MGSSEVVRVEHAASQSRGCEPVGIESLWELLLHMWIQAGGATCLGCVGDVISASVKFIPITSTSD